MTAISRRGLVAPERTFPLICASESPILAADETAWAAPPAVDQHAVRPRPGPPRAPRCELLLAPPCPGPAPRDWSHTARSSRCSDPVVPCLLYTSDAADE